MNKKDIQYELGQYMTPRKVAEELLCLARRSPEEWIVFDPACGEGALLLAAIRRMKEVGVSNIIDKIFGIDIDPLMVAATVKNISEELEVEPKNVHIKQGDFLGIDGDPLFSSIFKMESPPNLVVANPPYARQREYLFFNRAAQLAPKGTELIFIMPLAVMDSAIDLKCIPLKGKPFGVTTGHCFIHHFAGVPYAFRPQRSNQSNQTIFTVHVGAKLYELGAGTPPQDAEVLFQKPFSSSEQKDDWLPCYRTGDIRQFELCKPRLWVNYGPHLAHPKTMYLFSGPRLLIRRIPIWKERLIGAVYTEDMSLCAGDVLVVKAKTDDKKLLKGLCVYLNSLEAAMEIQRIRPTLVHRDSYPKFASKDINQLISQIDNLSNLLVLATQYPHK